MFQLPEFYSLHLILYPKLVSISSSIPSSAFLSHSFAVCQNSLLCLNTYMLLMSFSNVLATCIMLWTLPLFKHILAHFSKPKFIFISLLIVCTIFISFFKSFYFYLAVSSHPYAINELFSSQFHVLDTHNQLCSARLLMEWAQCKRVMAKESPLGIFLFVSEWVVTALLPVLFSK